MNTIAALVGRILLSILFIVSGTSKLFDVAGTEQMIVSAGFPPGLAIPTALFELLGGLAVAFGFLTRPFALLFAGFCLLTTLIFHRNLADPMQSAMALKNIAIAGGFLCLFAQRQMRWSYDSMRIARQGEIATREAEARAREADLRAARAEGRAAAMGTSAAAVPAGTPLAVDTDGDGIADTRPRRPWWRF